MGKMLSMEISLLEPFINIYSAILRKGRLLLVPGCPKEDCGTTVVRCSRFLRCVTCPDLWDKPAGEVVRGSEIVIQVMYLIAHYHGNNL